jgi:1,6-anhydro-N-acetylmuramate kinase
MRPRLAIGTMTGTSLDALDACLVRIEGVGLAMRVQVLRHSTTDLGALRGRLRSACDGEPMSAGDLASLALEFGRLHAEAITDLAGELTPDLVALHGQTVFHAPPSSWQLVNPWPVAQRMRCAVVSDLRGADLAAGGQGAPITPLADWILFRNPQPTAIVNLGGFCNVTWLPAEASGPEAIGGADICPCNHLLDAAARQALRRPFDADGGVAISGRAHLDRTPPLDAALRAAASAGRSLGTGDECVGLIQGLSDLPPADLLASVVHAVGRRIGQEACSREGTAKVVLAGGGVRNAALRHAITRAAGVRTVTDSAALGVPVEARESAEMAILGTLAWDGVPITLPGVTRRASTVPRAGQWCLPPT